ncbi:hypothetical protein Tco_0639247 [Tanacetum coccineum]
MNYFVTIRRGDWFFGVLRQASHDFTPEVKLLGWMLKEIPFKFWTFISSEQPDLGLHIDGEGNGALLKILGKDAPGDVSNAMRNIVVNSSHFRTRFDKPPDQNAHIDMLFPNSLSTDQQKDLECMVSKEDVKWQCGIAEQQNHAGPEWYQQRGRSNTALNSSKGSICLMGVLRRNSNSSSLRSKARKVKNYRIQGVNILDYIRIKIGKWRQY